MRFECWNCGRESDFDDMEEFVDQGWCRIGLGSLGRYSSLSSGSKRDFCFNCRELIDVLEQVERMQVSV
jgi:hypothetical protein